MGNILESSRKLFIDKNKEKVASSYNNALKNTNYFDQNDNVEDLYFLLRQIRDTSAVLKLNELFTIVSYLLRHFKVDGLRYELAEDKKELLLEGLRLLTKYFFSEFNEQETNLVNKSDNGAFDEQKLKLLIIDDDEHFTDWLKDSLVGTEFYLYVNNINNLKGFLLIEHIDLILINTVHLHGIELIEDLKSHAWTKYIPIFAISHSKDDVEISRILSYRVDDILIKPFSISIFLAKLRNYFSRTENLGNHELLSLKGQNLAMTELIRKEWVRFQRFDSYYSILLIKLDMYGTLLNTYGHDNVFEYLTQLYQAIKKTIRTYDEIKLWANDSLLVLLPATRVDGATMVARRIKDLAAKLNQGFLSKYILLGTVESAHEYQGPFDMIKKLERELIVTSSGIYIAQASESNNIEKQNLRKKVLIIDDDPATLTILGNHLNSDEWIVEELTDGLNALDKALEIKPDIIIAEVRSKDFDGYDFCYQIRQFPVLKDTIFIFLSKQTLTKAIVRGIKIGADDYITKPFSPEEVEIRMIRHLSNLNRKRR